MGEVYLARDTRLGRAAALKVLPADLMSDPERRQRFMQEARAASAVNHPAIAQIYGIEEDDDVVFIAMELVEGSTVRALAEKGELDVPSAVQVARQVADALAAAHAAGIVHRDIKSDNIMITHDGHPKILDFGLAKLREPGVDPDEMATMAMTQAGMVMGTVSYMSPEQARGLSTDHRSDVFSFGVVLYEMATGRLPFSGASALDTMHSIAFEPTEPITTIRNELPRALGAVVDRCLQKEPDDRYQDLKDCARDLDRVRRQVDSGVTDAVPFFERLSFRPSAFTRGLAGLTPKGVTVVGAWTLALSGIGITAAIEGGLGAAIPFLIAGLLLFGHVQRRRQGLRKRFVKKARKLKAVQLVGVQEDQLLVIVEDPTAGTYLKLNSMLESVNGGLYSGQPLTMEVREAGDQDIRELAMTSGVQYIRKDLAG